MSNIVLRPKRFASVSGGKDSLYMLNLILHNLDKYPLDGVVHFELEIDYPFIKNVIDYMECECKKYNIPFYRIKPRQSWHYLYNKHGMPTRKVRWCNSKYKMDCQRQLDAFLKEHGCYSIMYIGFCADEVKRFKYELNDSNAKQIYPLAEFDIKEEIILEWARTIPIFNDYYMHNTRCGCMFCPLSSLQNLKYLYRYYPNEFEKYICFCEETEKIREKELGHPFSVRSSNPKYNAEYTRKRVIELCSKMR